MKAEGYTIKDLEVLTGIKAHTIRIWEKRYRLLVPARSETNIRYYDDADLRRIINVSMLVHKGHKISKVAKYNDEKIKESVLGLSKSNSSEPDYVERLILYMLNFDNISFINYVNEIIAEKGLEHVVSKVFFELFERIGTYWQVGSVFPAQEHYVSNIVRQKIIAGIDKLEIENQRGKTILFFLPERELHEISLLFYAYLAQKSGYNVIYLGQIVPFEDLAKVQNHVKIDMLFTAFINAYLKEELEEYLFKLKEAFPQQKIYITGRQIAINNPKLPKMFREIKDYNDFEKVIK